MQQDMQSCIYVFDSVTANEAAAAVKGGHYSSIIQYHSDKQLGNKQNQQYGSSLASDQQYSTSYAVTRPLSQPLPAMQQHQSQAVLCPLDPDMMREREEKLNKLGKLAELTSQPGHHQFGVAPPVQPAPRAAWPTPNSDPLSSMEALSECPNLDGFGHTVHHMPN